MSFKYSDPNLCPECQGEMVARNGQYGKFWGCKDYPACKGTRDSQGRSKQDREKWKAEQKLDKELNKMNEEIEKEIMEENPQTNRNILDKITFKKN